MSRHSALLDQCSVPRPPDSRTQSKFHNESIAKAVDRISSGTDECLFEVRLCVRDMLRQIITLGDAIQGQTAKFPELPTPAYTAEIEALKSTAITTYEEAQRNAAVANKFAGLAGGAREYQQAHQC